uniref:Uncharacterized protein n=1 Tax=Chromera velia CCMP2878 TaxID=1169474 RepID=A0A0G4IA70_9ALVE|eukprot:Cvel_12391.t1-p1 / transcript=Cvel_12391.t1 / gene=Cvel_12391 / organism=Chromera_velia_CCMP2878 / gene_product=hypothetical protein / transcript_product=hypothetical protein / location=Cvel_scaffold809:51869-52351(+) / protein_length=161 / sequence_SO=supercontig / SO=protein_coding / is_pseudo=false
MLLGSSLSGVTGDRERGQGTVAVPTSNQSEGMGKTSVPPSLYRIDWGVFKDICLDAGTRRRTAVTSQCAGRGSSQVPAGHVPKHFDVIGEASKEGKLLPFVYLLHRHQPEKTAKFAPGTRRNSSSVSPKTNIERRKEDAPGPGRGGHMAPRGSVAKGGAAE